MADRYEDRYKRANERYRDSAEDTPDAGDEEEYDENADEDFNIDAAEADGDASSSDDDQQIQSTGKSDAASNKRKAEALIELDSGDEETIKERKKKKRKKKAVEGGDESEGDADEGGLIKTRAQRFAEKSEKKYRAKAQQGDVTIDVDAIWEKLNSMPLGRRATPPPTDLAEDGDANKENLDRPPAAEEKITIKRRIRYAGQTTEVEEEVLRSSKEAQEYLKDHMEADPDRTAQKSDAQRPPKRPSLFEPNPLCLVKGVPPEKLRQRAPSRQDVVMMERKAEEERMKKAERMTTVQKSALDWKAHVEKAGLREELDEYGRSNATFLGREAFLDRAAGAREDRAREARLKG